MAKKDVAILVAILAWFVYIAYHVGYVVGAVTELIGFAKDMDKWRFTRRKEKIKYY